MFHSTPTAMPSLQTSNNCVTAYGFRRANPTGAHAAAAVGATADEGHPSVLRPAIKKRRQVGGEGVGAGAVRTGEEGAAGLRLQGSRALLLC